ncbi:HugZ family pyridoxamine 5'-phosphate oxidase [Neptunicoccus cionae]|uniref:Pyridoxamine 5'-phosphate oxidase n=1 Tax=Neptunicoccus cionae TaxID=2035344 RepID=A0A916QPQ1_9RHOB|nr:pyridoxamine 5-phosphate oxidase [Amylibacter cionae]GGA06184.1 pyridoxamine 5'-phosphate oxidase [Amylibacter cionae]
MPQDPIRPTDAEAITLAKSLIQNAKFGALAVLPSNSRTPTVTRVAIGTTPAGVPLTLISDLSEHTKALRSTPECGLLLGEPESKGDPLTHPRISIQALATFVDRSGPEHKAIRDHYLLTHPKSKLYIDFADFNFVTFKIASAALNGGFGKAYQLTSADLS